MKRSGAATECARDALDRDVACRSFRRRHVRYHHATARADEVAMKRLVDAHAPVHAGVFRCVAFERCELYVERTCCACHCFVAFNTLNFEVSRAAVTLPNNERIDASYGSVRFATRKSVPPGFSTVHASLMNRFGRSRSVALPL